MFGWRIHAMILASRWRFILVYSSFILRVSMTFMATCKNRKNTLVWVQWSQHFFAWNWFGGAIHRCMWDTRSFVCRWRELFCVCIFKQTKHVEREQHDEVCDLQNLSCRIRKLQSQKKVSPFHKSKTEDSPKIWTPLKATQLKDVALGQEINTCQVLAE